MEVGRQAEEEVEQEAENAEEKEWEETGQEQKEAEVADEEEKGKEEKEKEAGFFVRLKDNSLIC